MDVEIGIRNDWKYFNSGMSDMTTGALFMTCMAQLALTFAG